MDFSNVINELKANPNHSFVSCLYDEKARYLKLYIAQFDEDEQWLTIFYEGGELFCDYGEEDSFSLEDLPEEIKMLNFKKFGKCTSLMGLTSEHAAYILFPSLPDPENIISKSEKEFFAGSLALTISEFQKS